MPARAPGLSVTAWPWAGPRMLRGTVRDDAPGRPPGPVQGRGTAQLQRRRAQPVWLQRRRAQPAQLQRRRAPRRLPLQQVPRPARKPGTQRRRLRPQRAQPRRPSPSLRLRPGWCPGSCLWQGPPRLRFRCQLLLPMFRRISDCLSPLEVFRLEGNTGTVAARAAAGYFSENESIVTGSAGAPSVGLAPGLRPTAAIAVTTSSPEVTLPTTV